MKKYSRNKKGAFLEAKNNNLISIGVTYGFFSRLELEREKANYIINDIQELANYF